MCTSCCPRLLLPCLRWFSYCLRHISCCLRLFSFRLRLICFRIFVGILHVVFDGLRIVFGSLHVFVDIFGIAFLCNPIIFDGLEVCRWYFHYIFDRFSIASVSYKVSFDAVVPATPGIVFKTCFIFGCIAFVCVRELMNGIIFDGLAIALETIHVMLDYIGIFCWQSCHLRWFCIEVYRLIISTWMMPTIQNQHRFQSLLKSSEVGDGHCRLVLI